MFNLNFHTEKYKSNRAISNDIKTFPGYYHAKKVTSKMTGYKIRIVQKENIYVIECDGNKYLYKNGDIK